MPDRDEEQEGKVGVLAGLLSCFWCASVWVAGGCLLVNYLGGEWLLWLLAASTVAIIVDERVV